LKKEAEATQGENAKAYDENLVKKSDFDFWKWLASQEFRKVARGDNKQAKILSITYAQPLKLFEDPLPKE
jgi:hypothetical protein